MSKLKNILGLAALLFLSQTSFAQTYQQGIQRGTVDAREAVNLFYTMGPCLDFVLNDDGRGFSIDQSGTCPVLRDLNQDPTAFNQFWSGYLQTVRNYYCNNGMSPFHLGQLRGFHQEMVRLKVTFNTTYSGNDNTGC